MRHYFLIALTASLFAACSSTGQRTGSDVAKNIKPVSSSSSSESFFVLSDPAASSLSHESAASLAAVDSASSMQNASSDDGAARTTSSSQVGVGTSASPASSQSTSVEATERSTTSGGDAQASSTTPEASSANEPHSVSETLRRVSSVFRESWSNSSRSLVIGPGAIKPPTSTTSSNSSTAASQSSRSVSTILSQPSSNSSTAAARPASAVSSSSSNTVHRTTSEVLRAVGGLRGLSGWTVVPLAHFQRDDRHVVVAWPALNSAGRLVDATVVGICLEETEAGELEECGRRWVVSERNASRAALVEALGGTDYRVMTGTVGTSLDELGPQLSRLGTDFTRAVSSRNRSGAQQAATAFVRMLPVDRVAFNNDIAQLLYLASNYNGRLDHERTVRNGDSATLTFTVRRGIIPMRTITATARRVSGSSDRWVLSSYR